MKNENQNKQSTTLNLSEDAAAELRSILQGKATEEEAQKEVPRIEIPKEKTFEEPAPSVDASMFTQPSLSIKDFTPTEKEKEIFLEAVLHDTEFQLPISLLNNKLTITLRSRSTYEQSLAFELVGDMRKAAEIDSTNFPDLVLWLQRFSVCMGLLSWGDKAQSCLRFKKAEPGSEEHENNKKKLKETTLKEYVDLPYVKWQTLLAAFNSFTIKEKLLLENVANQDFWNPVD